MDGYGEAAGPTNIEAAVGIAFREHWRGSVAFILSSCGDLTLAEDCVQEAFTRALKSWTTDGLPDKPGAWLRVTARRILIDQVRSRDAGSRAVARLWNQPEWQVQMELLDDPEISRRDDEIALMLLCCHPALAPTDQVLLMLRTVSGLTPTQIAPLFFSNEPGIRSRLTRAKRKIRGKGIPLRQPNEGALADRLPQIMAAVRLTFTFGHHVDSASQEDAGEFRREAIRLARILCGLSPETKDSWSLLALLLFTNVRLSTRVGPEGDFLPLADQDRQKWDKDVLKEAQIALSRGSRTQPSQYQLEAEIAAEHTLAISSETTDWSAIVRLYSKTIALTSHRSPSLIMSRAIALAEAGDCEASLKELSSLTEDDVGGAWRYHASLAHVFGLSDHWKRASAEWRFASDAAPNPQLQRQLAAKAGEYRERERKDLTTKGDASSDPNPSK